MSLSDHSYKSHEDSDEEYQEERVNKIQLRTRPPQNYKEPPNLDKDLEEGGSQKRQTRQTRNDNISQLIKNELNNEIEEEKEQNLQQNEEFDDEEVQINEIGIFYPDIDQILWRRESKDENNPFYEYLVKYKEYSYIHLEWIKEEEIVNDSKGGKNKLNRFNKIFEKKLLEGDYDPEAIEQGKFFDQTYVEVDRILHTTELFPVIHPKKAQDLRNKWTESLMLIVSKLLNFSKVDVHYGIYFQNPVNPELEGCPNYRKVITNPMDLGTVLNRLYLDYYKSNDQFWRDLGFVFKNCRKFNRDGTCEIRQLGDTLRECSIVLYENWHVEATKRYQELLEKYNLQNQNNISVDEKEKEQQENINQELQSLQQQQQQQQQLQQQQQQQQDQLSQLNQGSDIQKQSFNQVEDLMQNFMKQQNSDNNCNNLDFKEQIKQFLKVNNNSHLINSIEQFDSLMNQMSPSQQNILNFQQNLINPQSQQQSQQQNDSKNNKSNNINNPVISKNEDGSDIKEEEAGEQQQSEIKQEDQTKIEEQNKQNNEQTDVKNNNSNNQNFHDLQQQFHHQLQEQIKVQQQQIEISQQQQQENDNKLVNKQIQIEANKNQLDQKRIQRKKGEILSEEVERFNPGPFNFDWLIDENAKCSIEEEENYHNWNYLIEPQHFDSLDLSKEADKLYLVKWKNLSYSESTWEHESFISAEFSLKINDFKQFNRALDKESRSVMMRNNNIHKTLLELELNPRKRAKYTHHQINDMKNKLYYYDIGQKKQPFQYTSQSGLIFKGGRLLREYQVESLNWLIMSWYQKRNVILADEMGLGKTIQSISFLNHLHTFEGCRGPFLIIAPLSTLDHWKRTAEDWTNLNSILYYDGNGQLGREHCRSFEWLYTDISTKGTVLQTSEIYKFTILITSYEVFMADLEKIILPIPFQFIIVDEAHKLKNQNAKILQSLKKLPCKRYILLTGTPIQNSTEELWSLLNFIEPNKFSDVQIFKRDYGELKLKEQVDKLQQQLKPFMLRRVKTDVENTIPPLQETIIDIEMTNIQKTIYRGLYERNKNILQKNFSLLTATNTSLNNLEMQLRKCCNHPYLIKEFEYELVKDVLNDQDRYQQLINSSGKMILLDKLVQKFLKAGRKMLIFSQFIYILVLLEDYLQYNGIKYEKIDGSVKARDRQNAIDRFNNPEMKKVIFLLSTKAGGLGINLTAANIVIIFDSDWNPQNDVQATARAHRIGQKQEVTVYRFITKNTYESEMFERATKKLGQSQAIFGDGEFRQQGENVLGDDKKLSKKEVEGLLKKGILSYLEGQEDEKMFDENIDEILEKRTRVATHNMISGNCSFNKTQFVSKYTDSNIDINDPNFWKMVLPQESQTYKLRKEMDTNMKKLVTNLDMQKIFISKLQDQVKSLVESKIKVEQFNIDDQNNLNYILNIIATSRGWLKQYQLAASEWVQEVDKPSRRFKIINLSGVQSNTGLLGNMARTNVETVDEELIFQDSEQQQQDEENSGNYSIKDEEEEEAETKKAAKLSTKTGDDLLKKLCYYCERPNCSYFCSSHCKRAFHSNCRHKIEEGFVNKNGPEDDQNPSELSKDAETLQKLINNRYVCRDCTENKAICFICKEKGAYFGYEPTQKKKKKPAVDQLIIEEEIEEANGENGNNAIEEEADEELVVDDEEIQENKEEVEAQVNNINEQINNIVLEEKSTRNSKKPKNQLTKCSTANCQKFYHLDCIKDLKLFKYIDSHQKRFRCSLHYCQTCSISGDSMAISQCFRCHKAYHVRCQDKEKVIKLAKKIILCSEHEQIQFKKQNTVTETMSSHAKQNKNNSITNNNNQSANPDFKDLFGEEDQFDGKIIKRKKNPAKDKEDQQETTIKMQKGDNKEIRITRAALEQQPKIDKIFSKKDKKGAEKSSSKLKQIEKQSQNPKDSPEQLNQECLDMSDYASAEEGEISPVEEKQSSKKANNSSSKSKKKKKGPPNPPNFQYNKDREAPKYTYEQLNLKAPKDFDYENYQRDWCKYCGARFASNFTKGPWGARTLCTVHYIQWQQKKTLNLSQYKELPKTPINPEDLTEIHFLSKNKTKDEQWEPSVELESENIKTLKKPFNI